ncbi:MAG: hypothetical protein ACQESR_04590 [Planctomycetota bacterium]
MESCPTQAVLPLVGLAAEKVSRDRYICAVSHARRGDFSIDSRGRFSDGNRKCLCPDQWLQPSLPVLRHLLCLLAPYGRGYVGG